MIYIDANFNNLTFLTQACDLLGLEDRTLLSLGINVNTYRFILSLLAVLLCSISVAIAGILSFEGLLVPFSTFIVGNQHKYLIPTTALCGAIILLVADTIGRTLMAPYGNKCRNYYVNDRWSNIYLIIKRSLYES